MFSASPEINIELKNGFRKNYVRLLNFNTIVKLLSSLNYDKLYAKFKQSFRNKENFSNLDAVLKDLQISLNAEFLTKFQNENLVSNLDSQKEIFQKQLNTFFMDFATVLKKNNYKLEEIYPETADSALLIKIRSSASASIVTYYVYSPE